MKKQKIDLSFSNVVIDKKQLRYLIVWAFRNYGIARAANMADKLKDLGFYYATKAGISLSLEDLRIPPVKKELLKNTIDLIIKADFKYKRGEITAVERFQKVIDTWNDSSEMLKTEVIKYFKGTDPLNAIYMMAFSGARGNISQVRQLVGMRGLMSDPQGQIIDLPISSNFREGLTVTDYFISSYGARKGLVDTALRTADSGYLTRRLVDVAQDVIIRETDCKTLKGILLENIIDNQKILISLEQALIGRLLAEDLFHPKTNKLIAYANQDVDDNLAREIVQAGILKVLIRSPITCDANSSVCQKCYGWNLAHGRLVDLGEAVGIIAAQSIGEPGTQLTMRTFHTGGVFTGEFAEKILSPFDCIVEYLNQSLLTLTRTRHGEKAYLVKQDCSILLLSIKTKEKKKITLSKNTLLLVENKAQILQNQLIAEYPLKSRLTTEKAQKSVISDISGKICFMDLTIEEVENKQHIIRSAQKGGLIWVLSGRVHSIPDYAQIMVGPKQMIVAGSMLAVTKIVSKYSGYVRILPKNYKHSHQEILIIIASQTFSNAQVTLDKYYTGSNYVLETYNKDKFLLKILPNQKIVNQQIIGELLSDVYKTNTGGIIKYLDLPVSKSQYDVNHEYYSILGAGYILWISEETHEINKDMSLLLISHGDFIESGTEIIKNLFAQNSGVVEIIEKDSIVREIIIKPCKIYDVTNFDYIDHDFKKRGFLRPGEKIIKDVYTDKLVYWEYLDCSNKKLLLIRPVVVYSIPKKTYTFTYTNDSFRDDSVKLNLIRRIDFKDGARVKSVNGIDLIKTYLVIELSKDLSGLTCFVEFVDVKQFCSYLKFVVADSILIKDNISNSPNPEVIAQTRILIQDNSFVKHGAVVAQIELLSSVSGQIFDIEKSKLYNRRFLILTDFDKRIFSINSSSTIRVKLNDWIYKNEEIVDGIYASESGQIILIDKDKIVLRIGRPYLISNGSILHVDHENLIQRGESIATLIFDRAKTGDIIQGLPRIEEILEARKKSDSIFNPHLLLEQRFRFYLYLGLSLHDATRKSIQEIQLLLIKEVQLVYQSQGVDISDKHIEVIVKQMTSKVKIETGGGTHHLPGEMVELQKIEAINKVLCMMNKKTAIYYPILLGITKASLNTESFISAASFQETTKVLTEAAISGKLDWLRGLKENVIIGRLIPAGTGFNVYNHNISGYTTNVNTSDLYEDKTQSVMNNKSNNFDDIILDDRIARNYSKFEHNVEDLQPNMDII
uniref:DNA-directed RNA polymerase subunit beta'' n=1 Tax=Corallina officinalis TaxID=35170 RepID=A0A6M3WAE2_COROI|nr:RNA polymerase beta'' subunit [Corallina officinalis]QJF58424.1 RNA polymerase beta'' subunit [Corallina officinalis]QJF58623.1 RNA polymerase beta'' subunit [Corallina officinalis]QJF58822.1 RNA polymerase beta'' subunit [Corallina officinalis]